LLLLAKEPSSPRLFSEKLTAMPINRIQMVSFRNHEKLEMEFSAGINVIWGENGSGKTAVLEAIHLLSIGKSFRTNRIPLK